MGRQMPEYCEHGTLVCAGDFANPEDVQECPLCHIESLPFKMEAKDKRIKELEAERDTLAQLGYDMEDLSGLLGESDDNTISEEAG